MRNQLMYETKTDAKVRGFSIYSKDLGYILLTYSAFLM